VATTDFDVIIVGGGMVGGSMACALTGADLNVAVIEASPLDAETQPSFDERTIALTWSSRQIFSGLGLWDRIDASGEASPILDIEVSDRGHLGSCRLSHDDAGTAALGYVVPTRVTGRVLHDAIKTDENIQLFCPATVVDVQRNAGSVEARVVLSGDAGGVTAGAANGQGDGEAKVLSARLLVIADGGRSTLRDRLGFERTTKSYPQSALITTVKTDKPHHGLAYERFVGSGPLALLPIKTDEFAVVWTLEPQDVATFTEMSDGRFLAKLQIAYGDRAGTFESLGSRQVYPLTLERVNQPAGQRVVVIGNAAHLVHPVAGQGFNLGLKDVADLTELICEAHERGDDIGAPALVERYSTHRQRETRNVLEFTDRMIGVFASDFLPLVVGRNLGLAAVEQLPPVKRALLRRTMGLHGHQSKLASGRAPKRSRQERNDVLHYDVIIVGGGLIGGALACALGNTNYRVAILDKSPPPEIPTGDFQLRVNAYNRAAEKMLRDVGVWSTLPEERMFRFRKMYVGNEGGSGAVTFSAVDVGETYLGYFIENDLVTRALIDRAEEFENVDVRTDIEIEDIRFDVDRVTLFGANEDAYSATLLVGSDGAESRVRAAAGVGVRRHPYGQKCIVGTVEFDGDHEETAWQRFLTTGPLGLLPLRPGACSLAWSCRHDYADRLMRMDDAEFTAELDAAIQGRLGRITRMGPRGAFPLIARDAATYVADRTALIGDAAHVVHPLAGLGANIGFQDAAELAGLLIKAQARPGTDIGGRQLLRRYERRRHGEDKLVMTAMTGFNAVFSNDTFIMSKLRDRGLRVADKLTPAKNFLLRRAMWMNLNPLRR
jgi:2-octaprenyl-6-methoxyphenol hydroxylase